MIDPKAYAEITAKRPELAVPNDRPQLALSLAPVPYEPNQWCWMLRTSEGENVIYEYVSPSRAEALIGWHWTRMLPKGHNLEHTEAAWSVKVADSRFGWTGFYDDPISALTAFWRSHT